MPVQISASFFCSRFREFRVYRASAVRVLGGLGLRIWGSRVKGLGFFWRGVWVYDTATRSQPDQVSRSWAHYSLGADLISEDQGARFYRGLGV